MYATRVVKILDASKDYKSVTIKAQLYSFTLKFFIPFDSARQQETIATANY